jgi:hypothetical protein
MNVVFVIELNVGAIHVDWLRTATRFSHENGANVGTGCTMPVIVTNTTRCIFDEKGAA